MRLPDVRIGVGVAGRFSDVKRSSSSELSSPSFSGTFAGGAGAFALRGEETFGGPTLGTAEGPAAFRFMRPLTVLGETSAWEG